ncbi:hypothetical protein ACSS6W_007879 [Trichoderma asperelloides]|uniref:Glutathione S-transferase GST-6.0 n=1 Tax=Trichoderma asperellum TaxID=101201 RepID=A0A6V8R866_TRIAP|nr:putative glutathionine S-transferase [Trichoderma asperelloides]GFP59198.1 glutathione S-transferase GST-6.0 [Trichoderma asperellum]
MKLYIAYDTCSRAAQLVANELGIDHELVHFDVFGKSTSNGEDFAIINPLLYVPVLKLDNSKDNDIISETIIICSYLADQRPESGMHPPHGTLHRAKADQFLVQLATEIAQKHIPLMRKLMTEEGIQFNSNKLLRAYQLLEDRLADGRSYLFGENLTIADAYVWGTLWNSRSGVRIDHLKKLAAWKLRIDARPAAVKTIREEAEILAIHKAKIEARSV